MCDLLRPTRCFEFIRCTGSPANQYSPLQLWSSMPRTASNVDLPAPEGPMMETNSPGLMSKVMRRRTYILPAGVSKTFSRSRRLISGTPGGIGTCSATADGLEEKNTVKDRLKGLKV